jgi:hypothetical protein
MRVWVQNTPLIVDELCDDPLEVAAWRALDWLLTVFPDRRGFGSREIAERAHLNRKALTRRGDNPGLIDRLVQKGLIDIVGYEMVGFPNPRPIFSIDHRKLHQASLDAAPRTLLRFRVTEPPPPPHPDQMTMFDLWTGAQAHGATGAQGKEGRREGESPAPAESLSLPDLVRQELRQALADLLPAHSKASAAAPLSAPSSAAARRDAPATPPDQPPLADHPLDLWTDLYPAPRPIDLRQLDALINQHDQATGSYGAYWTGKAILAAALTHDQPTIPMINAILDRWRVTASYGSDEEVMP